MRSYRSSILREKFPKYTSPCPPTPAVPHAITVTIPVPEKHFPGVDKVAAESIYKEVNQQFNNIYKKDFTDVLVKVKEANLEVKKSPAEKKKMVRDIQKKVLFFPDIFNWQKIDYISKLTPDAQPKLSAGISGALSTKNWRPTQEL